MADGAAVQTGAYSAGWKAVSRSGTTASQSITGLTNALPYRVRVRAKNTHGNGAWVFGTGTPDAQATRSTNANLSGLTAASSTSSTGTFTDFSIGTFGATTTAYTASVANAQTHVKLTPTVADTGKATVGVRKGTQGSFTTATSGSASGAIALDVGANAITVRVTAEDGSTRKDYTVTVYRQSGTGQLAAPGNISYLPGDASVAVSWTEVADANRLVVQYCTSASWTSGTGCSSPKHKLADGYGMTSTTVTGLTNSTSYRMRMRAEDRSRLRADSPYTSWEEVTPQAPQAKTFQFERDTYLVPPGTGFDLRIRLSEAAPAGGLSFTLAQKLGTAVPTGLCDDGEVKATAEDIGANPPTTLTVQAGQTEGRVRYPSADNGDDRVGRVECFALQASTAASDWAAASDGADDVELTIGTHQTGVAFGTVRPNVLVPDYARAVSEGAGTVSVPVTVDYLPASSTTVAVEVVTGQGGGTATEYVDAQNPGDFRIQTKSVTFGPNDASRTQNLSVAITDDSDEESSETIVLRLTTTGQVRYVSLATGGRATLTIQDNETPPVAFGTMTVGDGGSWKGFRATPPVGSFSNADFTAAGVSYTILALQLTNSGWLDLQLDKALPRDLGLVLDVGATRFRFVDAVLSTGPGYEGVMASWGYANQGATPPNWRVDDTVAVSLGAAVSSTVKARCPPEPGEGGLVGERGGVPVGAAEGPHAHSGGAEPRDLGGGRLGGCRCRATRTAACRSARRSRSSSTTGSRAAAAASTSRPTGTATRTTRPSRWGWGATCRRGWRRARRPRSRSRSSTRWRTPGCAILK